MRFRRRLAVLVLALGWLSRAGGAEIVDRIVAIVDRHAITLSEAEQAMELGMLRGRGKLEPPEVVESLIESYLIEREVRRYPGEPPAVDDMDQAVASVRDSFSSEEAFHRALVARGMSEKALKRLLEQQLTITRYLENRFRALIYVNDDEIQSYYEEDLVPTLRASGEAVPELQSVTGPIREILREKKFNRRVDTWIESLKARAHIRRYVW